LLDLEKAAIVRLMVGFNHMHLSKTKSMNINSFFGAFWFFFQREGYIVEDKEVET
jgi:hypothetical protein